MSIVVWIIIADLIISGTDGTGFFFFLKKNFFLESLQVSALAICLMIRIEE